MGTTESVLIDPETDAAAGDSSSLPQQPETHARMTENSSDRTNPVPSSPAHMVNHRRRPLPPQHPSPDQRGARKPHVREQADRNVFQMHGLVLGLFKSGKRTLLQRLDGKEPDFFTSRTRTAGGDLDTRDEATGITTDARYQVPPQLPAFDKAIQLHVRASKKIVDTNIDSLDFAVILIDPRHDRSKVQKYFSKRVRELVRLLYGDGQRRRKPLCLIVLRNFCDLIQDENEGSLISISDLTMWTLEVLQDASILMETEPLLQCIDTSLLNCYGLSALHHFIYQVYLQRKRYDLQPEWDRIGAAIEESRSKTATLVVPYGKYLSNVERLLHTSSQNSEATPSSSSVGRRGRNDDETATTSASTGTPGGRRQIVLPHREEPQSARSRTQSGGSSSTLPSIQQSIDHAKDALEAFLESDSDDDEHENYAAIGNQNAIKKESVDDESEEDFYLDESGNGDPSSDAAEAVTPEVNPVGDVVAASLESADMSVTEAIASLVIPVEDAEDGTTANEATEQHTDNEPPADDDPVVKRSEAKDSNNDDTVDAQVNKKDDELNEQASESDSEFYIEEGDDATAADDVDEHPEAPERSDTELSSAKGAVHAEQIASTTKDVPVFDTPSANSPRGDVDASPPSNTFVPSAPPAPTSEISDAARAAIALAQQEFERLMRQEEDATADRPEKKKKKEKKSGSKKEKKSKDRN
jgi:hypothetical protein